MDEIGGEIPWYRSFLVARLSGESEGAEEGGALEVGDWVRGIAGVEFYVEN